MDYPEALRWLYGTQMYGVRPGLETIRKLCDALQIRTEAAPDRTIFHVAGTNGKGSLCAMLDSMCCESGRKTGLFTSPHLVSFRERIKVNGHLISKDDALAGLTALREASEKIDPAPTFFEIVTALALRHFQNEGCEIVVLETGMGGRLDATNVVTPTVAAITTIDLDHQQWLGDTLTAIAKEKAGIIKRGVPVVSSPQAPDAAEVLRRTCMTERAPLTFVDRPLEENWKLGLLGSHQRWNAAQALDTLNAARLDLNEEAVRRGLKNVRWPARFQVLGNIVIDGAHNPAAAGRLALTWREVYGSEKAAVILGILGDKDVAGICRMLAGLAEVFYVVPVQNPRCAPLATVMSHLVKEAPGVVVKMCSTLGEALEAAERSSRNVLITGSFFLAGEALGMLDHTIESDDLPSAQ